MTRAKRYNHLDYLNRHADSPGHEVEAELTFCQQERCNLQTQSETMYNQMNTEQRELFEDIQ